MNYRDFLRDFYLEEKAKKPHFSYQYFANRAGFRSKSFLKLVIDGRKNLSKDSLAKIGKALNLGQKAFSYFEDLVAFNQSESNRLRNFYFEKLAAYNPRSPGRLVLREQYEFYSKWHHNSIRELLAWFDFGEDYAILGKQLRPPIPARLAYQSVRLLLNLGLIEKKGGRYVQTDRILTTGDEVQSLAVHNFHQQNLSLAGASMDSVPAQERDISCLVLGLSREGFRQVKSEIQALRKRLLKIAEADSGQERVYHANFQLFPTSRGRE